MHRCCPSTSKEHVLQPAVSREISVEVKGRTAIVTFEAPSLLRPLQRDLWSAMNHLEADPNVAVVIFTGRRSIFMTGAALGEIAALKEWSAAVEYLELPHSIVSQF